MALFLDLRLILVPKIDLRLKIEEIKVNADAKRQKKANGGPNMKI